MWVGWKLCFLVNKESGFLPADEEKWGTSCDIIKHDNCVPYKKFWYFWEIVERRSNIDDDIVI